MAPAYYLGLMSGTSVDGVDAALLAFDTDRGSNRFDVLATLGRPHPPALRDAIATLCTPGDDGLDEVGRVDRAVAVAFADTALAVLEQSGIDAARVSPDFARR